MSLRTAVGTGQLRVGFIGCGKHASANLYPSIQLLGAQIVSVCARHIDRAERKAKECGALRAYSDYQVMLRKEDLDAVFVAAAPEAHKSLVEGCLDAGLSVFVEKPLGFSVREAEEIAEQAARVGKHVMLGFMKRFAPCYVQMKKIMEEERSFGRLASVTGMFTIGSRSGWGDEVYVKQGAIHYVDLLRFLFGEVKGVRGYSNTVGDNVDIAFSFLFDSGVIGNMFFCGLPAWKRHYEELVATGLKGFVKVDNMSKLTYHFDQELELKVPSWQVLSEEDRVLTFPETSGSGGLQHLYARGYVGEVEHFLRCVAEDRAPISSAADSVKTMVLCDTILGSVGS